MAAFGHHPTGCTCNGCNPDPYIEQLHGIITKRDKRIEELEKSPDVIAMLNAANVMDSQSDLITKLQQQVERVRAENKFLKGEYTLEEYEAIKGESDG